jgi:hypothetical protein
VMQKSRHHEMLAHNRYWRRQSCRQAHFHYFRISRFSVACSVLP